jgi:putative hydrolases of HD superfamily
MSTPAEVVERQVEAFRARDLEGFLAHFNDDIMVLSFDGSVRWGDKAALRETYGQLFTDSPDLAVSIDSRMAVGEFVVDQEHITGFHYGDLPTELDGIAVYRVVDGKIASMTLLP